MTLDNPLTRRQTSGPFCQGHKDTGLVACWTCFRSSGLKFGDPFAEARLRSFEDLLKEEDAKAEQEAARLKGWDHVTA